MGKALSLIFIGILWVISHQASAARGRLKCFGIHIDNGRAKIKSRGRVAKFKCNRGYRMFEGDRYATCMRGKWHGKIPKCITTGCEYYDSIPNGEAMYLYNDALVHFLCFPGYHLEGSSVLTCDGFGWNDTVPACKAEAQPSLSCDFEEESICGWTNGKHDQFDWTRNRGPTSSFVAGTGPHVDHTLGTLLGHYMYIDASIPRGEGDKARLFSPVYPAHLIQRPSCFSFFYHMFGNTTGRLNIYIKTAGQDLDATTPIGQMTGFSHDRWFLKVLHMNTYTHEFQVVLEAVRGHDYMSDIAIDDVQLAQGDDCTRLDAQARRHFAATTMTTTSKTITTTTVTTDTTTTVTTDTPTDMTTDTPTDMPTTAVFATVTSILVIPSSPPSANTTASTHSYPSSITTVKQSSDDDEDDKDGDDDDVNIITQTAYLPQSPPTDVTEPSNSTALVNTTGQTSDDSTNPKTTAPHEVAGGDDLSSCRNRCGEIAIESDDCGCDIECGNSSSSCCLDLKSFCNPYLSTPPPLTTATSRSTTSATIGTSSSRQSSPASGETFTTPQVIVTREPETSLPPSVITTVSNINSPIYDKSTVSWVDTVTQTDAPTTLTTPPPPTTTPPPVSFYYTSEKDVAFEFTSTEPDQEAEEDTELPTGSPVKTSTIAVEPPTTDRVTITSDTSSQTSWPLFTPDYSTDRTSGTTLPERTKTTTLSSSSSSSSSPQKGAYASSSAPSTVDEPGKKTGLSTASIYAVAFCIAVLLIIMVVSTIAYVRKRRRDKLPEDSDIRFLARDEAMMEENVFNLSHTVTNHRNSAI